MSDPGDTVYAASIPLTALLDPLHPWVIGVFMVFQYACNPAIHSGLEVVDWKFARSRWSRFLNTPISHALHHETGRGNFGFCFQFWDRLLGTCHPDYDQRLAEVISRHQAPRSKEQASP